MIFSKHIVTKELGEIDMLNKKLFKFLYYIFIILTILSFAFMLIGLGNRTVDYSFNDKTIADCSDGWTVSVDNGDAENVNLPVKLDCKNNAEVSIRKILPDKLDDYNCMMIESKRQEIYVFVGGRLRESYTDNGEKIGNSLPSAYVMVPIYNTDAKSEIRIEFMSDTYYSGNIGSIYLGSEMSLVLMLIKSNMLWFLLIGVIAVIGLVCLICYFLYRNMFADSIQFLHLFLFSLFTTIWCFSQIKIRQIFIHDLSVFESIGHCCFMLIPIAILLVSNYFSDYRHPKFHQFGIIFSIVNFLVQNIAHSAWSVDYFQMQSITQIFTFWVLTTCIGGCVVDFVKGRLNGRKLIVVGFLGQTLGITMEAVLTAVGNNYARLSYYIIGSAIYIIIITINTFFDFRNIQKAKQEAENANKAKSRFLATMSHEIRTPINVVLGMNEMILRESTDEKISEYAVNVSEAGKTLLSLVNDILDFSKIESGKMDIICVDYQLKSLLNDLKMMTNTRIGNKDIKLILDVDKSIPSKYYGDEVRVRGILTNILTNSVKYTQSGTITLSVKESERTEEDIYLDFSVKDTGMGIKPENIETLMSSSFVRFDEQKNRNIEGTGLGIAITRQLLELMESELKIDSVYGEGSNFHFILKQRIVDATPIGTLEQKAGISGTKKRNTFTAKAANILAVDDTRMNLVVISGLLKPYEMQVDTVASGAECIEKCKEKQYDIILMDHMMPEMDGIETLKVLKSENIISSETKVIAITANAISGAEEMYISNGFDGFLSKPVDVASLDACVRMNLPEDKVEGEGLN